MTETETKLNINDFVDDITKVSENIDYNKLVQDFGTQSINNELIDRFEKVTGKPVHPWIKRQIFFSHRDLDKFLDAYEKKEAIFIYTSLCPITNSLHIDNLVQLIFNKWLQDVFDCVAVIQIADDEKYYFNDLTREQIYEYTKSNITNILAIGFDQEKTGIFSNFLYRLENHEYEKFVSKMKKIVSIKQLKTMFGFNDDMNVGCYDWAFYQIASTFSESYPEIFTKQAHCLLSMTIDQYPYFKLAQDIAPIMKLLKPYAIISKFIPPLSGLFRLSSKIESSDVLETSLFLSDSNQIITNKIKKYAFSGKDGDINVDISYQYLTYFEYNDIKLDEIKKKFSSGEMTCDEIKKIMTGVLLELINSINTQKSTIF